MTFYLLYFFYIYSNDNEPFLEHSNSQNPTFVIHSDINLNNQQSFAVKQILKLGLESKGVLLTHVKEFADLLRHNLDKNNNKYFSFLFSESFRKNNAFGKINLFFNLFQEDSMNQNNNWKFSMSQFILMKLLESKPFATNEKLIEYKKQLDFIKFLNLLVEISKLEHQLKAIKEQITLIENLNNNENDETQQLNNDHKKALIKKLEEEEEKLNQLIEDKNNIINTLLPKIEKLLNQSRIAKINFQLFSNKNKIQTVQKPQLSLTNVQSVNDFQELNLDELRQEISNANSKKKELEENEIEYFSFKIKISDLNIIEEEMNKTVQLSEILLLINSFMQHYNKNKTICC